MCYGYQGCTNFPKISGSHFKILCARRVTCSKIQTEDQHKLGATEWHSLAMATWHLGFVHPCIKNIQLQRATGKKMNYSRPNEILNVRNNFGPLDTSHKWGLPIRHWVSIFSAFSISIFNFVCIWIHDCQLLTLNFTYFLRWTNTVVQNICPALSRMQ